MEPIVFPKPSFKIFTISAFGIAVTARKRETRKREMKAFNFNLEVKNMIAAMLERTKREVVKMLIV
jgi:hypothetical protein